MEAYVIQTDAGIRMFDSLEAAKQYADREDGNGKPLSWHEPIAVTKEKHYRGKIASVKGVLFTQEDQSYRQLLGAIHAECFN